MIFIGTLSTNYLQLVIDDFFDFQDKHQERCFPKVIKYSPLINL